MSYELWAWVVSEEDGTEGVIAAMIPGSPLTPMVLQSSKREVAERLGPIAENHGVMSGRPVRLAHLIEVE